MSSSQKIEEILHKKDISRQKISDLTAEEFNRLGVEVLSEIEVLLAEENNDKFFNKLFCVPAELGYLKDNYKFLCSVAARILPAMPLMGRAVTGVNTLVNMCNHTSVVGVEHKKAVRCLVIEYTKAVYVAGFAVPRILHAAQKLFTKLDDLCPKIKIFGILAAKLDKLCTKINREVIENKVKNLDAELKILDKLIETDKAKNKAEDGYATENIRTKSHDAL